MPFRAKIQPIGGDVLAEDRTFTPAVRQVRKSLLKKLFERQTTPKNLSGGDTGEFEPSSVHLRNVVENYMEDPNSEKAQQRCASALNFCNCFSGSGTDSSDDESSCEEYQSIKRLVRCTSVRETNLVINTTAIVEKYDPKDVSRLQIVADELITLGYDAAICKSRWKNSEPISCPAGEFQYLDVLIGGERLLIDLDFQSKFQIARPTKTYKSISQSLPSIFVGKIDRLLKIVIMVSDAAKQSFKKKGLHMPPWRRAEYVLTKWMSPHVRANRRQGETSGEGGGATFEL